jgi:hypothetical protein
MILADFQASMWTRQIEPRSALWPVFFNNEGHFNVVLGHGGYGVASSHINLHDDAGARRKGSRNFTPNFSEGRMVAVFLRQKYYRSRAFNTWYVERPSPR